MSEFQNKRPEGYDINHIDGVKTNNNIENLEYCTRAENILHAHRVGLCDNKMGEKHYKTKLSKKQVIEIKKYFRDTPKYKGINKFLGEKYEVSSGNVSDIKTGRRWKHVTI
jgi:hypothetical protein